MWSKNRQSGREAASNGETFHVIYRKSMSLNPFPVTDLRPVIELMHLLRTRRHHCHVWNRQHWTDSELTWTLSCALPGITLIQNYRRWLL